MNQINVLITGVGSASIGMQLLKALKLSPLPYYIVGTDSNPLSYGLSCVDKGYNVPAVTDPQYFKKIENIIQEHNIQVLLPGSETELKFFSKNLKFFQDKNIFLPINSFEFLDVFMNKYESAKLLENKKIKSPATLLIQSKKDIEAFERFPVICKPHINSGGSANVFIVQDKKELNIISEYLLSNLSGFLIQEYIGTPDQEYTVGVLCDMESAVIGSIALKRHLTSSLSLKTKIKNITGRLELGEYLVISSGISQGEFKHYPELTDYCEKVALQIGAKGAVNFQCRVSNNKFYIFEINPRFSGTTSLRAMAGFNEPDMLIRKYLLKESIEKCTYREIIVLRDLIEKEINI